MTNNKTQNKVAEPGKKVEELKTKINCVYVIWFRNLQRM